MTGGRRRREVIELHANGPTYARHEPPAPLPFEVEAGQAVDWWAQGANFRGRVNALLRRYELTFSQWRMLHAAEVLARETGDLSSQLDIRRRAHLDATTASRLMYKLSDRGWLDWGPDYYDSAYRISVSVKTQRMLQETRPQVVELARRLGARPGPECHRVTATVTTNTGPATPWATPTETPSATSPATR